jgi:uncharacterized membrane protein (DUF4010 family)
MDLELARHFLAALLIGALVGIEREKRKHDDPARAFGGIRTHILLALAGGASAWLARALAAPWVLVATLLAVAAIGVADHIRRGRDTADFVPGIVSEVAALSVVLLGAMVVVGDAAVAVALGIVVSAVLAFRQPLHGLVERLGVDDIPYQLWLMVIAISALSLTGYVAIRWLGNARGIAVTGIAGGLTSSTATTLSIARGSRAATLTVSADAACAGVLLAWLMMFVRVMVIVFAMNRALFAVAWPALAAMGVVTALFAGRHYLKGVGDPMRIDDLPVSNPFSLSSAIRFGVLLAVLLIAIRVAEQGLQGTGLYVVSGLAGAMDVDAITISVANGNAALAQAATALTVALLANTAFKCATVLVVGRGALRRQVALASVVVAITGAVATGLALM